MDHYPTVGQPDQLLLKHFLDRPLAWNPDEKIIYRDVIELTYRELHRRVQRLAHLLARLGLEPGDKLGVIDWDSHRYLECFFAVPMTGVVLHTINARLSPEQILFTINHAEDKVLFVHTDFLSLLEPMIRRCPTVKAVVLLSDDGKIPDTALEFAGEYESLLAGCPAEFTFPDLDENSVATLFYTTGTTGEPKGVFFTHRQLVLHTFAAGLALAAFPEPVSFRFDDVYMPLTPMFHVHAWGVPYMATLLGVRQVYPGRYEPRLLLQLIDRHQVSLSHCVPTILQMLLHHPEARSFDFSRLKVIIGGSALPRGLAQQAMARGIRIMQGYGLSETCPIIAVSQYKPAMTGWTPEAQFGVLERTGFPIPLVRAQVHDEAGQALPAGRDHTGELVLRAPWLTPGYFKEVERSRELWRHGWLHTGDLAYVDQDGYIRVTDRLKDVIKIGGEWISSLELEGILSQHDAVKEVAVVGIPDPKWDERPWALVVLRESQRGRVTARHLLAFLHKFIDSGVVHKRAVLTQIEFVDTIPRTSVGKVDKRLVRQLHAAKRSTHCG